VSIVEVEAFLFVQTKLSNYVDSLADQLLSGDLSSSEGGSPGGGMTLEELKRITKGKYLRAKQ